jgi:uncharacterized membrane protein
MAAVNVNQVERRASLLLGGVLLVTGLRRRSPVGAVLALAAGELLYRGISGHCHLYQTFGLSTADGRRLQEAGAPGDAMQVERSITIGKSADELYRVWREPGNLSRIMGHFAEVTTVSENRTHWLVRGPLGQSREWDVRVVEDLPGELLRWESIEGAELPSEGTVRFRPAPSDWGTEVTLRLCFQVPGGTIGAAVVKLLPVAPSLLVSKALRRFKSLVETGEIPTTEHQPAAR